MHGVRRIVVQLGTNNWQRGGEFAPGSGILHEAHHRALNSLDGTAAYSMYPSRTQRFDEPDVAVFELDHDIPICESISPVSSYRWHSMSQADFAAYRARLVADFGGWIDRIEADHGRPVDLAVAHHSFVNPLAIADINDARIAAGRPRIPVLCFVHGTALKMFAAEAKGDNPAEFPERFGPLMAAEGVFDPASPRCVHRCAAISTQQIEAFAEIYPDFPRDRVVLSPNGYNDTVFRPGAPPDRVRHWRRDVLVGFDTAPYEGSPNPARNLPGDYDRVVVFCGKFANWKRLDALLAAAAIWEGQAVQAGAPGAIATIIVGSGPHDDQVLYQDMADRLGLEHTWFVGPRGQDELATLFSAADVAVFPSKNEPFGLVFIEAMACGTPVIGADSGGPRDFVTDQVGTLVPESDDIETLATSLAEAVRTAIDQDWKLTKGPAAIDYAQANFSVRSQVQNLLDHLGL